MMPHDGSALDDLILQRTRPFIALCGKAPLAEWTRTGNKAQLGDTLIASGRLEDYLTKVMREIRADVATYVRLADAPENPRMVSIGPGNGIAEAMMAKALDPASVLLVDIEQTETHMHGFNATGSGYASLARAKKALTDSGVRCPVLTWNPANHYPPHGRYDFLFSMYGMGFHFPADAYMDYILAHAAPGSVTMFDVRRESSGGMLLHGFEHSRHRAGDRDIVVLRRGYA